MASPVPELAPQYSSPKRKRDVTDTPSSTPTRLNTNLTFPPPSFAEVAQQVDGSPRTAVAQDLEHLKLKGHGRGNIDFRLAIRDGNTMSERAVMLEDTVEVAGLPTKRIKTSGDDLIGGNILKLQEENSSGDGILDPWDNGTAELHDTSEVASVAVKGDKGDLGGKDPKKRTKSSKDSKLSSEAITHHPKAKAVKPRTRLKSPPMTANEMNEVTSVKLPTTSGDNLGEDDENFRLKLTWRDEEITGMDLDDPDDDGEGVNGIGYRPTAAQAYARVERRKQQIMEYKSREASEARARRMAKRTKVVTPVQEDGESEVTGTRKVRFAEGVEA